MTDMEAYRILTRELTRMHHTERDILDRSDVYRDALDAMIADDYDTAIDLIADMRTDAGDRWRDKMGVTFWGEKI